MHLPVFSTHPDTCREGRSIPDEPAVRLVIGGSGLSGNLAFQAIFSAQPHPGSAVYHTLHQICHKICRVVTDGLPLRIGEFSEKIAVVVLYPRNKNRSYVDSLGRECIICSNHVVDCNIGRTDTKGVGFVYMAAYTHLAHHVRHGMRAILFHQIC